MTTNDSPTPTLTALAEAHGVATAYWSFFGDRVEVPASTLRLILAAMGVDAGDETAALTAAEEASWRALLPPSIVVRRGAGEVLVHVFDGRDVELSVTLEDGSVRGIPIPAQQPESRRIDDLPVWRVRVPLPADLPLGWHTLHAREHLSGAPQRTCDAILVVTPDRLSQPPTRPGAGERAWGLMAQLYSVRSRESWGIGDYADLGDLATVAAQRDADFLLVNPIHAAEVTTPIEPSPYLPATRRFIAPLYIRPEDVREAAYLNAEGRARLRAAKAPAAATNADPELVDRDLAWTAKRSALEVVHAWPRSAARQQSLDAFVAAGGQALQDFALWCALEEHFADLPADGRPEEARDIGSPLVAGLRAELADRVAFHLWLQWVADEQAQAAQRAAKDAGMSIGVMHDLAVGVDPLGSDAWSLRDLYAPGIRVGAPPDMYNQQGQDWSQPPWLPSALAASGYAPLRDMVRNLLRHAGALRIDHVIGLFRLWWIPSGFGPTAGTYVRYDHEAMIGVLALEAERAGAVVIGEDLGNVEPWVRDYLASRGVLGTSVLWFEYEGDGLKPPEHYRREVLATVNTHDLPPTAGYLAGEHVELRARLGLLTEPVEQARAEARDERERMLATLRERGLIDADPTEQEVVEALHVLLTASPSLLLGIALVDAVGERRVQNQPGTHREYPNWQVPLAGPGGQCVLIDDLPRNARFVSLTRAVDRALRGE
ncbi:4-alpha-glucanotransferase [Microbacterium sp. AZCO]|uniref:4-alpha-glucanotransferase n=1 Tax=Microbacterium sp. AZCO TaxID=3142976 RepID=UPI0031F3D4FC